MSRSGKTSALGLIVVPAIVTLAVTLLRLAGELSGWSPALFNRAAGGPGSIVGIVWLVPVFGAYFGWRLALEGRGPSSAGRVLGHAGGGLLLLVAAFYLSLAVLKLGFYGRQSMIAAAAVVGLALAYRGWPALGRTLVAYGLAARIPVAIVMLVAIHQGWGTHYELGPPDTPSLDPLPRWFFIGLVPQLTFWIGFTCIVGALFGSAGVLLARRGRTAAA
jgi:hypothetical protein